MNTISLGKNLYLRRLYSMSDYKSNYSYPCEFPTIFEAYGQAIESGNWRSGSSINTPDSIRVMFEERTNKTIRSLYDIYFSGLDDTEHFELWGLILSIADCAKAYNVFRFGNHGTHDGKDISNYKTAESISNGVKPMIEKANILLQKITGIKKIESN